LRDAHVHNDTNANIVTLVLLESHKQQFVQCFKQIPPEDADAVLVFTLDVDPTAEAHLVWKPGQGPSAITLPSQTPPHIIGGSFIGFVVQDEKTDFMLVEDGFFAHMKPSTYQEVQQCLQQGKDIDVPGCINIRFAKQVFTNPITGSTLFAEKGWQQYGHEENLLSSSITLLTPDDDIGQRVTIGEFTRYIGDCLKVVESILTDNNYMVPHVSEGDKNNSSNKKPTSLFNVQCTIGKKGEVFESKDEKSVISEEIKIKMMQNLKGIPPAKGNYDRGDVAFILHFPLIV